MRIYSNYKGKNYCHYPLITPPPPRSHQFYLERREKIQRKIFLYNQQTHVHLAEFYVETSQCLYPRCCPWLNSVKRGGFSYMLKWPTLSCCININLEEWRVNFYRFVYIESNMKHISDALHHQNTQSKASSVPVYSRFWSLVLIKMPPSPFRVHLDTWFKATTPGKSGLSISCNGMLFYCCMHHHKHMVLYQGGPLCLLLHEISHTEETTLVQDHGIPLEGADMPDIPGVVALMSPIFTLLYTVFHVLEWLSTD